MSPDEDKGERQRVGQCVDCAHARRLVSTRDSVFYQCGRALEDAAYQPFPPLPVTCCPGHEPISSKPRDA